MIGARAVGAGGRRATGRARGSRRARWRGCWLDARDLERSPLHAMSVGGPRRGRHGGNARPGRAGAPRRSCRRQAGAGGRRRPAARDRRRRSLSRAGERLGALELETTGARRSAGSARRWWPSARAGAARPSAAYQDHGRIHVAADPLEARAALVADWLAAHRAGAEALMITPRLDDAAELSRGGAGALVEPARSAGPSATCPAGRSAAGDRVMALRNDAAPRRPERHAGDGARHGARRGPADGQRRRGDLFELPHDYLATAT